jgi:hypothetical protein
MKYSAPSRHECCLLILLAAATCLNIGCSNKPSPKALSVFAGFVYVGEAPYSQGSRPETAAPPHGEVELPFPKQLSAGRQYIFHHRRPIDDEILALETLPATFRALGLRVTAAPNSPADLISLFYGGPLFTIQFEDGGYTGYVFNMLCPQLMASEKGGGPWVEEDYVLAIPAQR